MAATISRINRERYNQPEVHRLNHHTADVEAATWRTFARAVVNKDGSGYIEVRRATGYNYRGPEGFVTLARFEFGPEKRHGTPACLDCMDTGEVDCGGHTSVCDCMEEE